MRKLIIGLAAFGALVGVLFGVGVMRIAQGPQLVAGTDLTGYVNAGPAGVHFARGELEAAHTAQPAQAAELTAYVTSASCSHTVTHSYSHTAKGTQSWATTTKNACGRNYLEWEVRVTHSYTGAHSVEHLFKDMYSYPHYHETVERQSWTAKGTYSIRWTHKSA